MPRASRSGIRGLYVDADGRRRIDLRYTDPKGQKQRYKEKFPVGTPARAAELRAKQVLADAITGTLIPRSDTASPTTLQQALDQYLEWVETNRPKAHQDRKSIVKVWIKTVGNVSIDALGPALLETYKSKRLAANTAPATINRGVATVKHMAGLAARSKWPWMTRERAIEITEVGMLTEPPGRQRPIKPKELDSIIGAFQRVDSRFARRVTAAALLTGCRLGEILTLTERDIDLKRKVLDLSKTKQNRNHQIGINKPMAKLIAEALADRGKHHAGHVFVSSRGRPYTVDGFSKHFAHVAERAGVPDITFHDLRRHVGTVLINSGERLEVVSKLLGHSTVAVTQRSYAHLTTEATRAAFDVLAKVAPVLPLAANDAISKGRKTG